MNIARSWWNHFRVRLSLRVWLVLDRARVAIDIGLLVVGGRALPDLVGGATTAAG